MKLSRYIFFLLITFYPVIANANSSSLSLFKLNSANPVARKMAVFYQSQTSSSCIPKLCKVLLNDKDEDVRATAASGLANFNSNKEAEDCLLAALRKEKSRKVRESIVAALVNFNDDRKVGKLMCSLLRSSKDPVIKKNALLALFPYRGLCDEEIYKISKQPKGSNFRKEAAEILGAHNYEPSKNYMMKLLKSKDDEDKAVALSYFKYSPSLRILPALKEILMESNNESLKSLAFDALLATGDRKAYKFINRLLIVPSFRRQFVIRLAAIKVNLPSYVINSIISSNDEMTRIALVTYMDNHKLINYCNFIKKNVYSKSSNIKAAAIWALGHVNCKDRINILSSVVENLGFSDSIRKAAAIALANLNPEELRRNAKLIKDDYNNEILDDIKDILKKALVKAQQKQ